MGTNLYFLNDKKVYATPEIKYECEDVLQELVAMNPDLLLRPSDDGKTHTLYLIRREQVVQATEDAGNSYSLDHLMVDDEGVPVLVEIKRSSDTRIRREVVAQMLDYACRASYWNIDKLKEDFIAANGQEVYDNLGEEFWEIVHKNLRASHLRLVFASDEIPDTLRILIEFMDRSMRDIEVYGVEIRRYKNDNVEMLSTNVVGNITKASEAEISKLPSRVWNEEDFIDYLNQNGFESNVEAEKMLRSFAKESGLSVELGHGANYPTFNAKLGKKYIFGVEAPNNIKENNVRVAIPYTTLANYIGADWDSEFVKSYFLDLPQIKPSQYNVYQKWMYISLGAFHDSENWTSFQEKIQTVIDRIKYAEEDTGA